MKKEAGMIDATPSKRLFLSIIADYDLNRSICELIDNALDIWIKSGKESLFQMDIDIDKNQQIMNIRDNAGGVMKSELRYIIGPGQTSNLPTDKIIGIFGVGTKRAVIALAQDVKITTRYKNEKTYMVEFDDKWLEENENWMLPSYEVDNISESTTIIELKKLRIIITNEALSQLKEYLQATYARFLSDKRVVIRLGPDRLKPISFENWAYPPKYSPRRYTGTLNTEDGKKVDVDVLAGLAKKSSPAVGEYGVYLYCNDRLVGRALKDYDVGFTKGLAGLPHPSVSLTRVIVSLSGETNLMPWNSSKSGINSNHHIFIALRRWLVQVVKDYASLSRGLEGYWPEKVFKYKTGKIIDIPIESFPEATKSYLPPLPKSKPRYADIIEQQNRKIAKEKPWVKGLYESIIAVDLIFNRKLEQKNRICLILLDSTLEIAFKEFLVNESNHSYNDSNLQGLFNNRYNVHKEIEKYAKLNINIWQRIEYYYRLRCKLIHERATVGIHDNDIEEYRGVVQSVLKKLFKLNLEIK